MFLPQDNRVAEAVSRQLQSRWRRGSKGFMSFDCPMCVERGENADKRHRGGVNMGSGDIGVFCFNCGFKSRFCMGSPMGGNFQRFLERIGVPRIEVLRLNHWALSKARDAQQFERENPGVAPAGPPQLPSIELPEGSRTLVAWAEDGCDDPDFLQAATYLLSRGEAVSQAADYYWTPNTADNLHKRVIIPCTLGDRLVGWTARVAGHSGIDRKYIKKWPSDFLFNADALAKEGRNTVIITEGVLDALALDAVGTGGASLNTRQIAWINASPKRKILLPDRDQAGRKLVDIAVENGWSVAFPATGKTTWWEPDVKDAASASERYGILWTLRSVLASAVTNPAQIRAYIRLSSVTE